MSTCTSQNDVLLGTYGQILKSLIMLNMSNLSMDFSKEDLKCRFISK